MAKRQAEVGLPRPLSAFAARKATTDPIEKVGKGQSVLEQRSQVSVPHHNGHPPPVKKQKTTVEQETLITSLSPSANNVVLSTIVHSDQVINVGSTTRHNLVEVVNPENSADDNQDNVHSDSERGQVRPVYGSESEGDDSVSDISQPGELPVQQLSSFIPTKNNVLFESVHEWRINLEERDILTLVGQYDVWVRRGAVTILGAVLRPSSRLHRVYAPSTHSLPSLRQVKDPFGPPNQSAEITIVGCSNGIRLLKHAVPTFRRIWNHKHDSSNGNNPTDGLLGRTFAHLKTSADDRHKRPLRLIEPLADRQFLTTKLLTENRLRPLMVMISGPKGSGKSTFARMLVNAMLTRSAYTSQGNKPMLTDGVAFLDVDPGQPEFSPPGDLSLLHLRSCYFGPPFTHPLVAAGSGNHLVRAHHVGVLSPKEYPEHYISCAVELLKTYQELLVRYPSCPLITNCAGWIQGTGLEVLLDLVKTQCFSDIVYTSTRGPQEVVESLAKAANKAGSCMHLLTSQDSGVATRTSADLRAMQMVSYFHLGEPEAGNLRWISTPITQQVPLVVHWSGDKQALLAVMALGAFDPETLFTMLNGCVVGLVALEDDQALLGCNASEAETQGLQQNDNEHLEDVEQNPETALPQPNSFTGARVDCMSDSDSDRESGPSFSSARASGVYDRVPDRTEPSTRHFVHSCVSRNSQGIPYINFEGGRKRLDPTQSHSLGQALVRGIDLQARCFHLLTPIPPATLQRLHGQRTKLVLVRGKLDTPKWASKEEYESGAAFRRRLRKEDPEAADHIDGQDVRQWADRTPYISGVKEPGIKSASAKVWRVRRDLKPRASGDDSDG